MTSFFEDREQAVRAAEKLKVYAQPQRLMVLSCLLRGELTVSQIDAATGIGQPALSQQLAELRRHELVKTRRASKQVWYELSDAKVTLCVSTMEAIFGEEADVQHLLMRSSNNGNKIATPSPTGGTAGFVRIV